MGNRKEEKFLNDSINIELLLHDYVLSAKWYLMGIYIFKIFQPPRFNMKNLYDLHI